MSTTSTPTRRRRIAGERRTAIESQDRVTADPTPTKPAGRPKERPADRTSPPRATEAHEATPKRPVRRWQLVALALVAVTAVVLAAGPVIPGVGVQAWRETREQAAVASAQRSAPAAAERAAAAILAYDHETLEADRDYAARFMTPDYRREYLDTFGLVLDNAPKLRAVVEAEVRASGVVHADPDRVSVLLFVNQTTTSTANDGEPQTALNRVVMTLQRDGGGWLVDGITSY